MGLTSLLLTGLLSCPSAPPPDRIEPMNSRAVQIPINFNPARRREIRELILFVSTDKGQHWNQEAVVTADKEFFPFYAKSDGEYWFSVVVVNQQGGRDPQNVYVAPPGLKVLIDTVPPKVHLRSVDRIGEEVAVAWDIAEDHPDLSTLQLEYQPVGSSVPSMWYTVAVPQTLTGSYRFRLPQAGPVMVRLTMLDAVKNVGSDQKQLGAAASTASAFGPAPATPAGYAPPSTPKLPVAANPQPVPPQPAPVAPFPAPPAAAHSAGSPNFSTLSMRPQTPPPGSSPLARVNLPPAEFVNTTQIALSYEIKKQGPSGVRRVDLYYTDDDGKTWKVLTTNEGADAAKSPICGTLPGEGTYGFKLVVESGAGLSKGPPLSGDLPDYRVTVDVIAPTVRLYEPQPDLNHKDTLILRWHAADPNLGDHPVILEYASEADGPWKPIGPGPVANTGQYAWVTTHAPYRAYLRVRVSDLAGNVGFDQTTQPVLIDLTKPDATIRGLYVPTSGVRPVGMTSRP